MGFLGEEGQKERRRRNLWVGACVLTVVLVGAYFGGLLEMVFS